MLPIFLYTRLPTRLRALALLHVSFVVLPVFDFHVLVQTALRAVGFWTVIDRALVVARNLASSAPVPFPLIVRDFKLHSHGFLVRSLVSFYTVELLCQFLLLADQCGELLVQDRVRTV